MNEQLGKFYGVGIGPGDPGLLTLRAVEVLKNVDVIFHVVGPRSRKSVSGHVVDSIEDCKARRAELIFSMESAICNREEAWASNADVVIHELKNGNNVAFVTLGDPLIYSTFGYLRRKIIKQLPDLEVEVVPGITSFQAAASVHGEALVEDKEILTVIPAWDKNAVSPEMLESMDTVVMLKTYKHRDEALQAIQETMHSDNMVYAARVGLEDQTIETDSDKISDLPKEYLSMLIAKRRNRG